MDIVRLSIEDWPAKELRSAETVVLLTGTGLQHNARADEFFRRLTSVSVPTVAILAGKCDASALAVLAEVTLGFVTDDVTVSVAAATVLALGLTSSLPAAVGAAPARGLLFGGPLDAGSLRASGLARTGDPADAAGRLTDPAAALLVRSLRVAARSTVDQARQYDAELRQLG